MGGESGVRERSVVALDRAARRSSARPRRAAARGRNFLVEWIAADGAGAAFAGASGAEAMLLLPDCGAEIAAGGAEVAAAPRSVAIVPPGAFRVTLAGPGVCICLTSEPPAAAVGAGNAAAYAAPDPRIAPVGAPFRRVAGAGRVAVIDIDTFAGDPRASGFKMLQSATMSINWVEADGPRDRSAMSPHSHAGFEQGSLSVHGDFIHHLRVPWGRDMALWRDDERLGAPAGTLLVIPVGLIHTTEWVGAGRNLLIDVFAPPRRDFIASGWVHNAADYADPQRAG